MGKVLDRNRNLNFENYGQEQSFPNVQRALFPFFNHLFVGLQCFTEKLQIFSAASFLYTSRRGFKESPNKLLNVRFWSKLSSVKSSAQM